MPRLSKIGAAALAAFGWTGGASGPAPVTASYLVVAGGGSGGTPLTTNFGLGGGGAGGMVTGTTSLNSSLSYVVTVGAGGSLSSGSNSSIASLVTAIGGGIGGQVSTNGASGGSGGGGGSSGSVTTTGGSAASGQGNAGGGNAGLLGNNNCAAGGGGAGAVGGNVTSSSNGPGVGGAGLSSSISGTSVTYAGGGGGGIGLADNIASGGTGGGGAGGGFSIFPVAGTANLGGGGGGGAHTTRTSGNGGSGVVIVKYTGAQQFGGGIVSSDGTNTIHTFKTSGTLSPINSLNASYLIVAGGGAGGYGYGAGGGAGGMQTGSGLTIDTNSTYLVTVGAGGAFPSSTSNGNNGGNSSFSLVSTASVGGGGGGSGSSAGNAGGSGGGGGANGSNTAGGSGTSGQGNAGGTGNNSVATCAGGGGGAGAVGGNANSASNIGGNGGVGLASSISGTSTYYAGGGGGYGATGGAGGNGGGGQGGSTATTSGTANTGGGGGAYTGVGSGAGGSGIVIISYPGSTQLMAGGTVTVVGGNVIHTFTSSGYLSPLTYVGNSLRFRSSASAYLSKTPTVASNRKTWTWSAWVKRGASGGNQTLFGATVASPTTDSNLTLFGFSGDVFVFGGGLTTNLETSQVFRDYAAWYHIVCSVDTTLATANNRIRLYVNGSEITAFGTRANPTQNLDTAINSAVQHDFASSQPWQGRYFDGYMAEVNFIDGQQLTPNAFGTFNQYGVWQPINYGGSYGTNGFYLKFNNTTSTTTLGYDSGPANNNWTCNNISLTAGVTYDSMTDVPTLTSATTANYCTLNPLNFTGNITNGNLTHTGNGAAWYSTSSTIGMNSSQNFYAEATIISNDIVNNGILIGIIGSKEALSGVSNNRIGSYATGYAWQNYLTGGTQNLFNNGTGTLYNAGAIYTTNDVIGIQLNNGTLTFYKNGVSQGSAFTGLTGTFCFADSAYNSDTVAWNFGQRPFAYTTPTGALALNTYNLPDSTIPAGNKVMDATLYTANASTQVITNAAGFKPDFVWTKSRGNAYAHLLYDSVRGVYKSLGSNNTGAEITNVNTLLSFNSNGFTLGFDDNSNVTNGSAAVGWQWQAGQGTTSSNTSGSITSTVSVNAAAGFSVVTYTGTSTGSSGTIGHGLGVTPAMVITKRRDGTSNWIVWHQSLPSSDYILQLNNTAAQVNSNTDPSWLGGPCPAPTSTTFGANYITGRNVSGQTCVAYCWAEIAGFSKFGSYTGNGSNDGTFIYTGFRPKYVMIKCTQAVSYSHWVIKDTSRNTYNASTSNLYANFAYAEDNESTEYIDILSNGFKIRGTVDGINGSGNNYIYICFAENPFKYANAR